jgi:hypothetical protein
LIIESITGGTVAPLISDKLVRRSMLLGDR